MHIMFDTKDVCARKLARRICGVGQRQCILKQENESRVDFQYVLCSGVGEKPEMRKNKTVISLLGRFLYFFLPSPGFKDDV